LKRTSPAVLLAVATAFVILADAVVVVAPQVLADPRPSLVSQASIAPATAAASPTARPTLLLDPGVPTYSLPTQPPGAPPTLLLPPTPVPTPTPTPAPYHDTVTNAKAYAKARLGAAQYSCFDAIIMKESKWNPYSGSPSGPYGIPQANPGSKMASFGSNWKTSPLTQVKWGIWYVTKGRYGSACEAWDNWQAQGWY